MSNESPERILARPVTGDWGTATCGPWALDDRNLGNAVEYTHSDLLTAAEARAEAAEAERDRLRMILESRDAFDAGEPSKPPHTGKDRATLAEITGETNDHTD